MLDPDRVSGAAAGWPLQARSVGAGASPALSRQPLRWPARDAALRPCSASGVKCITGARRTAATNSGRRIGRLERALGRLRAAPGQLNHRVQRRVLRAWVMPYSVCRRGCLSLAGGNPWQLGRQGGRGLDIWMELGSMRWAGGWRSSSTPGPGFFSRSASCGPRAADSGCGVSPTALTPRRSRGSWRQSLINCRYRGRDADGEETARISIRARSALDQLGLADLMSSTMRGRPGSGSSTLAKICWP